MALVNTSEDISSEAKYACELQDKGKMLEFSPNGENLLGLDKNSLFSVWRKKQKCNTQKIPQNIQYM